MNLFKKNTQENGLYDLEIREFKSKYRVTAELIFDALGEGNYIKPYNCMTRFRANIKDKKNVKVDEILKIPLVKGVNWNGPELQIIIGGEVQKVVDEFKAYEIEGKKKKESILENRIVKKPTLSKRFMAAIVGIIQPAIAVIIAGGMLVALYSLLSMDGGPLQNSIEIVTATGETEKVLISMQTLYLFGVWDSLFFILANTVMPSIGLFFIFNTARYFDANPWFAITVGLFLLSQGFFPLVLGDKYDIATNISDAHFGEWISDKASGKSGFFLFALGSFPIVIMGYQGSIIPYIVGGLLVVFIDKWIKTWMPAALDITFRGLLVILMTMMLLWFVLAPVSSLIEFGLFKSMTWLGAIPYGFGTALFTMLWQPLVIIGCHTPLGVMIDTNISNGTPQLLGTANVTAYWGQLGAVIAVGITTKNMSLKKMAFATVPAGIFGITEPIIYGVNLPRVKPFIYGCMGALAGGFLIGILDIDMDLFGTFGILSALRFNDHASIINPSFEHRITYSQATEVGLLFMVWAITFGVGFVITFLCYRERTNELKGFKKSLKVMAKWLNVKTEILYIEFNSEIKQLQAMKNQYKEIYNYYGDLSKIESKMLNIELKENVKRSKMYRKLVRMQKKVKKIGNNEIYAKFLNLNKEYESFALYQEKAKEEKHKADLIESKAQTLKIFSSSKEQIYNSILLKINKKNISSDEKVVSLNKIWNSLESVEIAFDSVESRNVRLKIKE
ncbi:hypothetical protein CXP39_00090 [Mesoplasma syrphidae]|uniref:Uncharacterized protein n=1 Tax=Mesoplasma syrphidae TaxID=225999 RepID=A0A2K9BU07_9MOLU|nr:PTS transporter subunit EIIC [Mesoplasma syrphidae]AUF83210.1 hypothetical protein CXP39_00090 [Mesoplasma syrphidae]